MLRNITRIYRLSEATGQKPMVLVRKYLEKKVRDFATKRNLKFEFAMIPDSNSFSTWHKRPKRAAHYEAPPSNPMASSVAIVLQGGLLLREDFTLETIRFYKQLHPQVGLILSTWQGESAETLSEIEALGVTVVLSEKPSNAGISNTNLQMRSAHLGVRRAQDLGYEYVLKTRADQRFYSSTLISYLLALIVAFPLAAHDAINQISRVIALDVDSFKYRIYGLSDFMLFGVTSDVLNYWNGDLDPRLALDEMNAPKSLIDYSKMRICEVFFATRFLERTGWPLAFTLSDWWEALSRKFLIVDGATLDFYWPKYSAREYLWRRYKDPDALTPISHSDWLSLATGQVGLSTRSQDEFVSSLPEVSAT